LPGFLELLPDYSVMAKRLPHPDSVVVYSVLKNKKPQGKLSVYHTGLQRKGFSKPGGGLPIKESDLVGEKGISMLRALSDWRIDKGGYSQKLASNTQSPDDLYLAGGVGKSFGRLNFFGDPQSFRRHSLVWKNAQGAHEWVDLKIPGQDREHYHIQPGDFISPIDVYETFLRRGEEPPMACPFMMVSIPADFKAVLYGQAREPDETIYLLMEHLNGRRLVDRGRGSARMAGAIPEEYIRKVANANGRKYEDVVCEMIAAPLKLLAVVHESGYLLNENAHYGNFTLCTDSVTRFVSDMGGSMKMDPLQGGMSGLWLDKEIKSTAFTLRMFEDKFGIKAKSPWENYYPDPNAMKQALELADAAMKRQG
jgi:hypothetical protein